MRKSILSIAALCILVIGVQGCDGEEWDFEFTGYPVSIGDPSQKLYDPAIIGVWERRDEDSDSVASLVIETSDMQTYQISLYENRESEPTRGVAFAVEVSGIRFLNMQLDDIRGFFFLRYDAHSSEQLTLWWVEEAPDEEPITATDLLAWIAQRVYDEELYAEPEHYTRVALWSRCPTLS